MTVDTTVLGTSKAVVPVLAWSLDGDDGVVDFPIAEPEPAIIDRAEGARYSWGAVCRRAVLLVASGAAAAAAITSAVPAPTATVTATAQSPTSDNPGSHDPDVCAYIRSGHTVQQAIEAGQNNGAVPQEYARAYIAAAINYYCPEISASAAGH